MLSEYLEHKKARCENLRRELESQYPRPCSLTLEIGCGHGHYLTTFAESHPEENCLGIDLVTQRIMKALKKRDKRQLHNLHFLKAEVEEFMEVLPEYISFHRIFILFPDPWPKKRHAKNRIVQASLLTQLAERAESGATLHFRTDHEGQFAWTMQHIVDHPRWKIDDSLPWPLESTSYFQDLMHQYFSLNALKS